MIPVMRSDIPKILLKNGAKWTQDLLAAKSPTAREKAESKYKHKQIKHALVAMFKSKCAYCESKIAHVTYGHIEHFRPKRNRKFISQTFAWSNLVLACCICNGNKSDVFPDAHEGGPLVNPCDDKPDDHFLFEFNPKTKLARVRATSLRGETTERQLKLNRYDLLIHRSKQVKRLVFIAARARIDAEAMVLLNEAQHPESEYSAFVRSLAEACA